MTRNRTLATLRRDARAAAQARRILSKVAPGGCEATDTAALLLSEAVSNAVRHSDGADIKVAVTHEPAGTIVGAVFDTEPRMGTGTRASGARAQDGAAPADDMETGRGLDLMAVLASSWGVATVGDVGKWVWFQIPVACGRPTAPA